MSHLFLKIYRYLDSRFINLLNRGRLLRLRLLGASVGKNVVVYGRFVVLGDARNITLGDACTLNEGVLFNASDKIVIGKGVRISPYTQIHTGELNLGSGHKKHNYSPVKIGDYSWLASGATILPGVTIGANSIVAAGAVATRDIADHTLAAGIPAKPLRQIAGIDDPESPSGRD